MELRRGEQMASGVEDGDWERGGENMLLGLNGAAMRVGRRVAGRKRPQREEGLLGGITSWPADTSMALM